MTKILVVGIFFFISTVASAKDMDDVILQELESQSSMTVSLKTANRDSQIAANSLLAKKYKKFRTSLPVEPSDGMIVALRPTHR